MTQNKDKQFYFMGKTFDAFENMIECEPNNRKQK